MVHRATGLAKQFVDFVGRYEDLVHDLVRVLTILDRPFDEVALRAQARENVSRKLHGEPVWHPSQAPDPRPGGSGTRPFLPRSRHLGFTSRFRARPPGTGSEKTLRRTCSPGAVI